MINISQMAAMMLCDFAKDDASGHAMKEGHIDIIRPFYVSAFCARIIIIYLRRRTLRYRLSYEIYFPIIFSSYSIIAAHRKCTPAPSIAELHIFISSGLL